VGTANQWRGGRERVSPRRAAEGKAGGGGGVEGDGIREKALPAVIRCKRGGGPDGGAGWDFCGGALEYVRFVLEQRGRRGR